MTPASATRVGLVYGWAAVAPGGAIVPWHIYRDESLAKHGAGLASATYSGNPNAYENNWRRAYRAGWRAIRVQISPAGEREDL